MKKLFLLFILLAVVFTACNKQKNSISADIEGLGNDTVFVHYIPISESDEQKPILDTVFSADNKFVYDIPVDKAYYVMLEPAKTINWSKGNHKYKLTDESNIIFLVVEPDDKVEIKGKIGQGYIDYTLKGTYFNEEYSTQRHSLIRNQIKADSLINIIDYYVTSPNSIKGSDSIVRVLKDMRKIETEIIRNQQMEYIKNNPDKDLAAYYLLRTPSDTFAHYYKTLDTKVMNGVLKNLLTKRINDYAEYLQLKKNKEKIKVGADAPDFTLKNLDGKDVTLSDIKGKYIVLDFWGSWCGWCIKGYPEMKKYYDKYKDKVEFVGIACKDNDKDWRKAVEDNKLDWTQLFNDESGDVNKNVSLLYAVEGYPTKIIINKDMKIESIILGERPEFYQKLDELLK